MRRMAETAIGNLKLKMDDSLPLRDVVFHTLRDAILEGILPPGTRLMEIQISNQLGVSRTPVREAIHLLDMEGLVKTEARKGTIVAPIQASDLRDSLEVRKVLETLATVKACKNMDDQTIRYLQKFEKKFEDALNENDIREAADVDAKFHGVIVETAHNRRLTQTVDKLSEEQYRYRLENLKDQEAFPSIIDEHRKLMKAFTEKDEDWAAAVIKRHIENQQKVVLKQIEKGQVPATD